MRTTISLALAAGMLALGLAAGPAQAIPRGGGTFRIELPDGTKFRCKHTRGPESICIQIDSHLPGAYILLPNGTGGWIVVPDKTPGTATAGEEAVAERLESFLNSPLAFAVVPDRVPIGGRAASMPIQMPVHVPSTTPAGQSAICLASFTVEMGQRPRPNGVDESEPVPEPVTGTLHVAYGDGTTRTLAVEQGVPVQLTHPYSHASGPPIPVMEGHVRYLWTVELTLTADDGSVAYDGGIVTHDHLS